MKELILKEIEKIESDITGLLPEGFRVRVSPSTSLFSETNRYYLEVNLSITDDISVNQEIPGLFVFPVVEEEGLSNYYIKLPDGSMSSFEFGSPILEDERFRKLLDPSMALVDLYKEVLARVVKADEEAYKRVCPSKSNSCECGCNCGNSNPEISE